jgi:hypothetical protein
MDLQQFYQIVEATKSEKLQPLLDEELEKYHKYFVEVHPSLMDGRNVHLCEDRIELIRGEIGLRRVESLSKRQHGEAIGLGWKTLTWTKIAGLAAIAAVIVPLILVGIQTCRSTSPPASPMSSPKKPKPIPESSTPEATPIQSPQQSAIKTPLPEQP